MWLGRSSRWNASIGLTAVIALSCSNIANAAEAYPVMVQQQLQALKAGCKQAGGKPEVDSQAVQKVDLRGSGSIDWVIDSKHIDCVGAPSANAGAAGYALILAPSNTASGKGFNNQWAFDWKIEPGTPPVISLTGGIDCAKGWQERCTTRLRWNGSSFAILEKAQHLSRASSNNSIVGYWAQNRAACQSPAMGLITIGPKSLVSEEMSCSFDNVLRQGSTVIWNGTCDEGQGRKRRGVTATENAGHLTIKFQPGGTWNPLIQCGAKS